MRKFEDGKDNFWSLLDIKESDSSLVKYMKYIANSKGYIDIDVCEWAVNSYIRKYTFLKNGSIKLQKNSSKKYEICINKNEMYRGDTMNSFSTIFKYYINKINGLYNKNFQGIKELASCILKDSSFKAEKQIDYEMNRLSELTHTEGNFIPIPLKFNVERSGFFANTDYWDLVMDAIYKWYIIYDKKNDMPFEVLLNRHNKNKHIGESLYNCKMWLSHFKTWEEFLNDNYLTPYVDVNLKPIEFWKGHFEEERKLKDLTDPEEFLNAIKLINSITVKRNEILI